MMHNTLRLLLKKACPNVVATRCATSALAFMDKPNLFGPETLREVKFSASDISAAATADGTIVFPFHVSGDTTNCFNSMHGGALATLADVFTTIHLWGLDSEKRHVSANFEISYISPALSNSVVECRTRVTKDGKRLAFTEFEFVEKSGGKMLAKGSHTKAYI